MRDDRRYSRTLAAIAERVDAGMPRPRWLVVYPDPRRSVVDGREHICMRVDSADDFEKWRTNLGAVSASDNLDNRLADSEQLPLMVTVQWHANSPFEEFT